MKECVYTYCGVEYTETPEDMLNTVFGDFNFKSDCISDLGITATHTPTGKEQFWPFLAREDFELWCYRCFPDDAYLEEVIF